MTEFRIYEDRDLDAVFRMWKEVGWIRSDEKRSDVARFIAAGIGEVALLDGEAECLVHRSPGRLHYAPPLGDGVDLKLSAISAVTTSPIARRRGFASRLTARALAAAASDGFEVAALGMFEQGFYDRLGFGTAGYEHLFSFDPAQLDVAHVPFRAPERLTADHAADVHAALDRRKLNHGAVRLSSPFSVKGEIGLHDDLYALGYRDDAGALTHCLVGEMKDENGPWSIYMIAYETTSQLMELFRLFYELSDQFRSVRIYEPAHVQLQALLREPFRERQRSEGSKMASHHEAHAWMQLRMLDVGACVAACRFPGDELSFNLELSDPLTERLEADSAWRGCTGTYRVRLGARSSAEAGKKSDAWTLEADVGAFTRLWFGVAPATVLAATDALRGPSDLLEALDRLVRLPRPVAGLEF